MHTLLIIDDSTTVRATVRAFLKDLPVAVSESGDGLMGLAAAESIRPELILVDVMMPRLSGYQVCAILKKHPELARIPTYMLTSKNTIIDKAIASLAGADGFIAKPFTKAALLDVASRHGMLRAA